ncbi:DNA translocase FtsK [Dulcicalothrix desertica]|uniref:DNA translocase FtsK n=2 Tax=Dulcicalothrix desertica TaxID=32056 RepID=UPI00119BF17D|nr:DNA translocase FtsK [Dulcicalothrix desertica]TWH43926.1 S-DNA-T family DNA segregation ATPase FtsK/SpoIIIE [Dulcicalothrix desertica PCC 7102]
MQVNYSNEEIYQAVTCLKGAGLSNQEILAEALGLFDFSQQLYVLNLLQESEFGSKIIRPVKSYDHNYLFEILYQAVISGTPLHQIIEVCESELSIEDLAFSKLSLEYILTNRYISKYERNAFILDLYKLYQEVKSYKEVIQVAELTKNIYLKQLAYKTVELVATRTGETLSLAQKNINTNSLITGNENKDIAFIQENFENKVGDVLVGALNDFGITCNYIDTKTGPTFKRVKIKLGKGVSFKKVQGLGNDLVQQLGEELGLENPPMISVVPGAVVFDIPRLDRQVASFADYVDLTSEIDISRIVIPGGVDVNGKYIEISLCDSNVYHSLGGGMTGAGKSQYEKAMVLYLALRYPPSLVKLALSDVKLVSLTCFNGLPHLVAPVAEDAASTLQIFNYLVAEQELRYQEFKRVGVENINEYNQLFSNCPIPRIVSVTDECFDLLSDTTYKDPMEMALMKLLAKAGAAGINIFLFTQRPDKDVIKPLIRSNCSGKIAFMVSRPEDSGIILGNPDDDRAASLLGGGDMLYKSPKGVMRLQGLYLGAKADFQALLDTCMTAHTDTPCWNSGLDFSSFGVSINSNSGASNGQIRSRLNKAITQSLISHTEADSLNVYLDDLTKSQIISLHSRGYELHQIIQEIFKLSRADGRRYKRVRDIVYNFIVSVEAEDDDDN